MSEEVAIVGATVVELAPARVVRADVTVRDGRITGVAEGGSVASGLPTIDASGCVVTPAFAVGHTHLYSALACGMPPPSQSPTSFREILERVWWRLDKALDDELVHISALVGAIEAARRGAAFVVDHHASPNAIDGSLDRIASALDLVGVRGALCYETTDRDGAERSLAGLRENERFITRARRGETPHMGLVGAHAPFTLEDRTLEALRDLADRHGVGLHVHVAEDGTDASNAHVRGTQLERRLQTLGIARAGSIVAHAVHLEQAAIDGLSAAGAWVVTNARSNMNNAVGLSRATGDRIALGTDGIGADMIAEAQAHFFRHAEARDGLAGLAVARLAAAQRLAASLDGRGETAARVAPGERADLAILSYDPPTPMTAENLAGHVLFGWTSAAVRDTMVGGRLVMRNRVMQTVDESAIMERARAGAKRLWERMEPGWPS
jgi:putative selenium metabolism protein SsnA